MILIIVVLYLIVLASNKTRELKQEELSLIIKLTENSELKDKYSEELTEMSTSKLFLTLKLLKLKQENKRLKESNEELRDEHDIYLILKQDYEVLLRSTKLDLEHIQKMNTSNMTDKEIIHERYIAAENILKDLNKKIKELENRGKSI